MAKSENQKLKLLYIMDYLLSKTDELHPVTTKDIISYLESLDISAERKSIYSDIDLLRFYGIDIVRASGGKSGYFVASRNFQLPELKLLVDAVQSSKFITGKKSLELITKLSTLTSTHEAKNLRRQVYVKNRIINMNESIYYNVDEINTGIINDKVISFKYFDYSIEKKRIFRHDGKRYFISPFALIWDDENYYMAGYDESADMIKHFRVDKMSGIKVEEIERSGRQHFDGYDMSQYSSFHFGMFTGDEQIVKLRFENGLAGAVLDRFGKDVMLIPDGDNHFTVSIKAAVSSQFYGWLCGFGPKVRVLAPESIVNGMSDFIKEINNLY